MERQNQVLRAITEALPATVVIVDGQGRYCFANSAFERYVGRSADQILGRTAIEVLGAEEVMRRKPYMVKAVGGEPVDFVLDYPGEQGTTWLALSCIPLRLDGRVEGFVGISQDITLQRREQAHLAHLAERDPLTGLLNRAGLEQRLAGQRRAASGSGEGQAQAPAHMLALLYIDLDHFKPVNDTLGHLAGDQVLQGFARRLVKLLRSADVVARMGGDEFVVLLTGGCTLAQAERVAQQVLEAAAAPFDIDGRAVTVSASIGVVSMVPQAEADLRELLVRADHQLYRAKAAGRGRHCSAPQTEVAPVG